MKTALFDYYLPEELIAQTPVEPRDHSRLLVYNRQTKEILHKHFYDIVDFLKPDDILVVNNTKVIPARLYGEREGTHGKVELLLLKRRDLTHWDVILKPGKTARIGTVYNFSDKLKGTAGNDLLFQQVIRRIIQSVIQPQCKHRKPSLMDDHGTILESNINQDIVLKIHLHRAEQLRKILHGLRFQSGLHNLVKSSLGILHASVGCHTALFGSQCHCSNGSISLAWCKFPHKPVTII